MNLDAMSPAEARRTICEDVVAQVEAELFRPAQMVYMAHPSQDTFGLDVPLHDELAKPGVCRSCAIGSLIIGLSRVDRSITAGNVFFVLGDQRRHADPWRMRKALSRYFSEAQIALMESAFEQGPTGFSGGTTREERIEAAKFGEAHDYSRDRLLAIMRSMIAHPECEFHPAPRDAAS